MEKESLRVGNIQKERVSKNTNNIIIVFIESGVKHII